MIPNMGISVYARSPSRGRTGPFQNFGRSFVIVPGMPSSGPSASSAASGMPRLTR